MAESNGNGTRFLWWFLGALVAPFLLAFVGHLLTMTFTNAERVSALEAKLESVQHQLGSMETKLDRLLEKR
jgi:hypothetical protein